jgi:hypothetical protein
MPDMSGWESVPAPDGGAGAAGGAEQIRGTRARRRCRERGVGRRRCCVACRRCVAACGGMRRPVAFLRHLSHFAPPCARAPLRREKALRSGESLVSAGRCRARGCLRDQRRRRDSRGAWWMGPRGAGPPPFAPWSKQATIAGNAGCLSPGRASLDLVITGARFILAVATMKQSPGSP